MAHAEASAGGAGEDRRRRGGGRWPWAAAGLSGLLLAAAFPGIGWSESAWVALVPLMLAVRTASPGRALRLGVLAGGVFWLIGVHWIRYVTVFGWLALAAYCALFIGVFAWFSGRWFAWAGGASWWRNLGYLAVAPAVWVALEYLRAHLFTGFTWNTLAVSQYRVLPLIQLAAWGGVYAISAVIVCFNAGVATTLLRYREAALRPGRTAHPELLAGLLVLALAAAAGLRALRPGDVRATPVRIGLVQPGIPQIDKWTDETVPLIYRRLEDLTRAVQASNRVDLVVWPETALPDDVRFSEPSYDLVRRLVRTGPPLLVGSMDSLAVSNAPVRYFNSSFLFDNGGEITGYYDKRHLVMFGEYIPLENWLPFLDALTPNLASFSPGTTNEVLYLRTPDIPFTPLICFEDTIPGLSRESVRAGARLLVNQTNDAWFERSAAARQHLAHCVFRCVENRVPAVRAANTGVSCFIDRLGRVNDELVGEGGDPFGPGHLSGWALVPPLDMPLTCYTRHGDRFAQAAAILGGGALLIAFAAPRRRRRGLKRKPKRAISTTPPGPKAGAETQT